MPVLSVAAAKQHLGLSGTTSDPALEAVIAAAEKAIAVRCGFLEPTDRTDVVEAHHGPLALRAPVVSVTSITPENGSAVDVPTLTTAAKDAGTVPGTFYGTYTVVYVSGRASVPADLLMGVKELVAHLWNTTQRSAADRRGRNDQPPTGSSYVFPNRVEQWIAPYVQAGIG